MAFIETGISVLNFGSRNSKSKAYVRYEQIVMVDASAIRRPKHALWPAAKGTHALGDLFVPSGFKLNGFLLSNLSGMNS